MWHQATLHRNTACIAYSVHQATLVKWPCLYAPVTQNRTSGFSAAMEAFKTAVATLPAANLALGEPLQCGTFLTCRHFCKLSKPFQIVLCGIKLYSTLTIQYFVRKPVIVDQVKTPHGLEAVCGLFTRLALSALETMCKCVQS